MQPQYSLSEKKVLPGAASAASTTSSRSTPSHALVFDLSISLGELEKRRENCIWKSHLCWHQAIAAGNLHLEIETPELPCPSRELLYYVQTIIGPTALELE